MVNNVEMLQRSPYEIKQKEVLFKKKRKRRRRKDHGFESDVFFIMYNGVHKYIIKLSLLGVTYV